MKPSRRSKPAVRAAMVAPSVRELSTALARGAVGVLVCCAALGAASGGGRRGGARHESESFQEALRHG